MLKLNIFDAEVFIMNLNFFTAKFPFFNSEPIIGNEFPYLEEAFEKIKIFPHFFEETTDHEKRGGNAEVVQISNFEATSLDLKTKALIIRFFLLELWYTRAKWFYLKKTMLWLGYLKKAAQKAKFIEQSGLLLDDAVNYSYWMNDWALVLTFLRKRGVISNFVFRCGGFDIWDERHEGNYLPFRGLIYRYTDAVFPNSEMAEAYIKQKTKFPSKVSCKYLGVTDFGQSEAIDNNNETVIVSCSSLIPLKRVELIVKILHLVERPVKWIHFGDGPERSKIEDLVAKHLNQHEVILKGNVSNATLLEYYQKNRVDLFMTTSYTEGLPVSIQEAISFGIPVIATNVGAMSEVVNDRNGLLIERDFDIEKVAKIIEDWPESKFVTNTFRDGVRLFWQENFDAKTVYSTFVKDLMTLKK